jgi:hypothetical protein
MYPGRRFWRAFALVAVTGLAVWGTVWIFMALRIVLQGHPRLMVLIGILAATLLLTPVPYYAYWRETMGLNYSRRRNILVGLYYAFMGAVWVMIFLRGPNGHDLHPRFALAPAFGWFLFAAIRLYRALEHQDNIPHPS